MFFQAPPCIALASPAAHKQRPMNLANDVKKERSPAEKQRNVDYCTILPFLRNKRPWGQMIYMVSP